MRRQELFCICAETDVYEDRVENQKNGITQIKINKAAENTSYAVIGLSQLLALFSAVVVIFILTVGLTNWNICCNICAFIVDPTQASHVLSQSYGMATHELG